MECLLVSLGEGEAILDNWETYTQWSVSLLEQKSEWEKVQVVIEAGIVMNEEQIRVSHDLPRVSKTRLLPWSPEWESTYLLPFQDCIFWSYEWKYFSLLSHIHCCFGISKTNVETGSYNRDNKNNQFYERRDSLDSKPRWICRAGNISKKLSAILRKPLPRKEWAQCPRDFILSFQHTGYELSKMSTKCFERKLLARVFLTRAEVCVSPRRSLFPKF